MLQPRTEPLSATASGLAIAVSRGAPLLAFLLLSAAILRSGGSLDWLSLTLVLLTLGLAVFAIGVRSRGWPERLPEQWLPRLLGGLTAVQLLWLGLRPASAFLARNQLHLPALLAASLIGLVCATYAWKDFSWPRWRIPAIMAVYFALGAWLILKVAPAPAVDVWHFQQHGSELLLHGDNPYAGEYPNPYEDARFLGEKSLRDGKIQAFPYPPLSLLLVLPGYLVGDVRWGLLLAMIASAGFLVATGRKLGLPAGHPAELAAIAFHCNPWGMLVVELGWTEPLLALAASIGVWALASGRQGALVLALVGVLSLKQYGFLLLPAFAASRRVRWSHLIFAGIVTFLIALPFALWNPPAFWRGIVEFHLHNPLRKDSLSVLAALSLTTGHQLSGWPGLVMAAIVGGWIWRRGVPSLSSVSLGSAAVLLAFFAFNRAAHLNYYWLVLMFLAMGVITATAEQARDPAV